MVDTNDYYWVTLTQKNMVTSDSNYNHFFWVVVTGQFLQCVYCWTWKLGEKYDDK